MEYLERRFEKLRQTSGSKAALGRLSNAAFLLEISDEFEKAPSYLKKLELVLRSFQLEAGHKVMNLVRHRGKLPPLRYDSVLRKAGKELGVYAKGETIESLEEKVIAAILHLREPWDPFSDDHRRRLTTELNRAFRSVKTGLKGKLTRALSVGLLMRTLKSGVKGLPPWAKTGSLPGVLATGAYAAYKLGEPDYSRMVIPCILVFALARADIETAPVKRTVEVRALPARR